MIAIDPPVRLLIFSLASKGPSTHGTEGTVGAHAVLKLDQAGSHTSPKLHVPENISLLPLPSYAPELNPVEQVWARLAEGSGRRSRMEWQDEGYLRANSLSHRVWNSYDAFVNACCNAWNKLMKMLERLASITRRTWARAVSGLGGW